jgi:hypothetical protein
MKKMTNNLTNSKEYAGFETGVSKESVSHLIWCALISLYLHKQQRGEMTSNSENFHLLRWYARAMKNRTFAEKYSQTLRFLLHNWQESGLSNQLHQYLLHMWIAYV